MTVTPEVESPLAIGALGIQRRVILRPGKDDMAFSFSIDSTADRQDVYQIMDLVTDVADREALKAKLAEKYEALEVAKAQPAQVDREIDRLRIERTTALAAMRAMHDSRDRRMPFKMSAKQEADLQRFDDAIENAKVQRKNFARDVPIIEWEIACLKARIAGAEPPERPRELDEAIDALRVAA